MSLGAPFWYGALKQLLQLRSKIAQDDDVQRKGRQTTAGPAAISPDILGEERGDAAVVG